MKIEYVTQGDAQMARSILFPEPAGLARASGTVTGIDVLTGELRIKPKGLLAGDESKTYKLTERSLLLWRGGGVRTYLASVQIGDEVQLDYFKDGDALVVWAGTVTPIRAGL